MRIKEKWDRIHTHTVSWSNRVAKINIRKQLCLETTKENKRGKIVFCRGSGETLRKELGYDGHAENFQKNVLLPHNTQSSFKYCVICAP